MYSSLPPWENPTTILVERGSLGCRWAGNTLSTRGEAKACGFRQGIAADLSATYQLRKFCNLEGKASLLLI
jgi:hypothetical protein